MNDELILSWKNSTTHMWVPVGRLKFQNNCYFFQYTKGAQNSQEFKPFEKMDDLNKIYESEDLFPLFKNRLLQKSRPEYTEYLGWLGIKGKAMHPMEELALTGGVRATDSLQLFPIPVQNNGYYEVKFFSHGIRYLAPSYIKRANKLENGARLYIMKDIQNPHDKYALTLRTEDPPELVGYCPKNYVKDFNSLVDENGVDNVEVSVVKNNISAPSQLKLLCQFRTKWFDGFIPFSDEDFQPIVR